MSGSFDAAERRVLDAALAAGQPLRCPRCRVDLARHDVPRPDAVSYVRHRIHVTCPVCKRSAGLDLKP